MNQQYQDFQQTSSIPQAPASERAILGLCSLDSSLLTTARDRLTPRKFFNDSHREIFEALLALDSRGVTPDPIQLLEELRARGTLDRVGGPAYVASLTDGTLRSDFGGQIERVLETAAKRMLWTATMRAAQAANNGASIAEIAGSLRQTLAEIEPTNNAAHLETPALSKSWADFDGEEYPVGERIAFTVERGEIVLLNALPNAGKTTLAVNVGLALAAGREFAGVVTGRTPRRVLYVDAETRRARLQRDLRKMTRGFSREETIAVGRNLHVICEAEIKGESLSITRTDHLLDLSTEAIRIKPDLIVLDTLSSLCPVFNENDNAEQTRKVWRPLQKLARDCDAAILVLHHVGKRGSEEGQAPERVYRGRGASAAGGAARAVWLLIPDPTTPGLSTLSCVKAKGDTPPDQRFLLDQATRWFGPISAPAPALSSLDLVLQAVGGESATGEIVAALKSKLARTTVKEKLAEALSLGFLEKTGRGKYRRPAQTPERPESTESTNTPSGLSGQADQADFDERPDWPDSYSDRPSGLSPNPQETKKLRQRPERPLPIGVRPSGQSSLEVGEV